MHLPVSLAIRLLTHNIRYATHRPFKGEELWHIRAPRLLNELRFNTSQIPPTFICLQEVLHNQLEDIIAGLPDFNYIGVGRDDGKEAGEYSPILYRPDVWELLKFQPVWLSETPDKPSKGWDAATIRILTVGVFRHRDSGKKVLVLNTHLDHRGDTSRLESAKLIDRIAMEESNGQFGKLPVVLSGDFNSPPDDTAYQYVVNDTPFVDVKGMVEEKDIYGNDHTSTGFTDDTSNDSRIDFIFVRKNDTDGDDGQDWEVQNLAVLANKFDDGVYDSDHRAVVADLLLC
ncbi:MAG: hypothetical protein MMC23_008099 [Stictis urceolatum]|nr:hypothetical protein [Stictis urceolata]